MRWQLLLAVTFGLICGSGRIQAAAATDPASALTGGLVARVHFVGSGRISTGPNAARLNELAALPETAGLRALILAKVATIPYREYQTRVAGTNEFTDLIGPMLDDLFRSESFLEARNSGSNFPETVLAVRLAEPRAALWQTNLATILTAWTRIPITSIKSGNFTGWELKKHVSPSLIRFYRANGWVVIGLGDTDLSLMPGVLQRIADKQRPVDEANDYWLDAAADWLALVGRPLMEGTVPLSKVRLVMQGRKGDDGNPIVRQQITAQFARPLGLDLKPWHVPTNLIHGPVTSFAAARGLATGLAGLPLVKTLDAAPVPDQLFTWAVEGPPLETCWAAQVVDAQGTNYLNRIAPGLVSTLNSMTSRLQLSTGVRWTNNTISIWGLPFATPFLEPVRGPTGDYLAGAFLPPPRRTTPVPDGLIAELTSRRDMVLYSWEITGKRLMQTRPMMQLYSVVAGESIANTGTIPAKWLDAAGSKLDSCGTMVARTGPAELTLVRNSTIGLAASELTVLSYWLEAAGFPYNAEHPMRPGQRRTPGP